MCSIGFAIGIASFAGSAMSAVGQHQSQQAAVARSNAIAQQRYHQDLQIAAARDREKGRVYQAESKEATAAKNAYYAEISSYQAEANRALAAENQKFRERENTSAFQSQSNIAKAIQSQGTLLSTGRAGQSFLLAAMDADRQLGFEQAQVEQTLYDAAMASGVAKEGILLDQASANNTAWNGLPADPLTPEASFLPVKPIKAKGPSGLALAGNLVASAASAYGTGYSLDRLPNS